MVDEITAAAEDVETTVGAAMKKAGLLWLTIGGARPFPVWHAWVDGATWVLHGGDEQPAPGLAEATDVDVVVPAKDNRVRTCVWRAAVEHLAPGDPRWDEAVAALLAERLNLADQQDAPQRWAATCRVARLTPVAVLETAEAPATTSGRAVVAPTPATTRGPSPRTIGRATKRRPRGERS